MYEPLTKEERSALPNITELQHAGAIENAYDLLMKWLLRALATCNALEARAEKAERHRDSFADDGKRYLGLLEARTQAEEYRDDLWHTRGGSGPSSAGFPLPWEGVEGG